MKTLLRTGLLSILAVGCLLNTVVYAAPQIKLGVVSYDGQSDLIQLPVTFTNDSAVTAIQFDIEYPVGALAVIAVLKSTGLSAEHTVYSNELVSVNSNTRVHRVVIIPSLTNADIGGVTASDILSIPFSVSSPASFVNSNIAVKNIVMSNAAAVSVLPDTCIQAGFIVDPTNTTADTDGDGLTDSFELAANPFVTHPASDDTDCDTLTDKWEIDNGFNPTDPTDIGNIGLPPGTDLSGVITTSLRLAANTTYQVTTDFTMAAGTVLIMEEGARLEFATGTRLIINGALFVNGVDGNPVLFTSSNTRPFRGSWKGILINNSTVISKINYATIMWAQNAIEALGAHVEITNSVISEFVATGIKISGIESGLIDSNVIDNIRTNNKASTCIRLSDINSMLNEENLFIISNNLITRCQVGVDVYNATPLINGGNNITLNGIGIAAGGGNLDLVPVINGNNIYSNTPYNYSGRNFTNRDNVILNAEGNWWGSADTLSIVNSLFDATESLTTAKVDFVPFLDDVVGVGSASTGSVLLGPAANDVTLAANAVYDIIDDFVVDAGATLVIEEGATIRVHGRSRLIVDGRLQIQGTDVNRVVFDVATSIFKVRDNWEGILINATGTGSVIEYADIKWARTAIEIIGANVTLRHNNISEFLLKGIDMKAGAGGVIDRNIIDNINQRGIGIHIIDANPAVNGNTLLMTGNQFLNSQTGIKIDRNSSPLINSGNTISANNFGIHVINGSSANPLPVVQGNNIYNNTGALGTVNYYLGSGLFPSGFQYEIRGNWWGVTNLLTIKSTILDNNLFSPLVSFEPVANGLIPAGSNPPLFDMVGDLSVASGSTLTATITATTGEGGPAMLTVSNLPFGASFVDDGLGSATLTWATTNLDAGTYSDIVMTASDGVLSVSETISIIVNPP